MKNSNPFPILLICLFIQAMFSCRKDKIEPSSIDSSVKVDSLKVLAGRDISISSPRDFCFLDGSETTQANPGVKDLQYTWRCVSYPPGTQIPQILKQHDLQTEVNGLNVGKYLFELEVRLKDHKYFNTVAITVNPDELIGKTINYISESAWYLNPETNQTGFINQIITTDLVGRDKNKILVEYWNEFHSKWKPVIYFSLFSKEGRLNFGIPWWDYPESCHCEPPINKSVQARISFN